jgi:hypothetical protein
MSNIAKRPGVGGFLAAIFLHWRTAAIGALTIPFTCAALYVSPLWQRILYAVLALVCVPAASYRAWNKERERLVEAQSKCAELEEDKLLNRSPRLRISVAPINGISVVDPIQSSLVRGSIEIDCWNDGKVAAYHVSLAPLMLHFELHFESIDCIPPGEKRVLRGYSGKRRSLYVYILEPQNGKVGETKGWFFPNLEVKPDLSASKWKIPMKLFYGDGSGKHFISESTLHFDTGKYRFYVQQGNISFETPPL